MKLLLTGAFKYNEEQLNELMSLGYEIVFIQDERIPLQVKTSDIEAVVCNSLFLYNDIRNFKKLKFIQLTSAGYDRLPLDYIKEHGIKVFNAKSVYSIPMAEWIILKILEIYKKSKIFYEAQHEYKWEKQRELLELTNKTVAIIGFGDIGFEVAKRLRAFGVYIIGVGRGKSESNLIDEYRFMNELDDVLKRSDIVILALPLTKETKYLFNREKIEMMKNNSVLINVSRGEIIDESALKKQLLKNKFLGVALDVFKEEPLPIDNTLWNFDKVIITPHNSFISDKVNERLFKSIIENLKIDRQNIC